MMIDYETNSICQAPVVQRVDNAIIWINVNPGDNAIDLFTDKAAILN